MYSNRKSQKFNAGAKYDAYAIVLLRFDEVLLLMRVLFYRMATPVAQLFIFELQVEEN